MAEITVGEARPAPGFPPGVAYVDGRFCPISEAKISVLDWGFLHSDATYDVVHVWQRRFFRLEDHLDRFQRSVAKLRMTAVTTVTTARSRSKSQDQGNRRPRREHRSSNDGIGMQLPRFSKSSGKYRITIT